jgi:hypothetical protein
MQFIIVIIKARCFWGEMMRREWALDVKSSHLLNAFFLLQFGSTFLRERERERFEKHSSAKPSYQ